MDIYAGNLFDKFVNDTYELTGIASFGIVSVLWALPYYENTKAALYLELKKSIDLIILYLYV